MTRTGARELAVMLNFCLAVNPDWVGLDDFFNEGYYETLKGEDELFERYPDERQLSYIRRLVSGTLEKQEELDKYISKYSKNWKIGRISKTAVAILRTAIYEVLYMDDDVPNAVAMNEAVELSKGYEEQETAAFINGILGSFYREEISGESGEIEG